MITATSHDQCTSSTLTLGDSSLLILVSIIFLLTVRALPVSSLNYYNSNYNNNNNYTQYSVFIKDYTCCIAPKSMIYVLLDRSILTSSSPLIWAAYMYTVYMTIVAITIIITI